MNRKVVVGVGSTNPVKIEATREAFNKIFESVEIISIKVQNVSKQPFSIESMISNAMIRAKKVMEEVKVDYAVGIEGGIYVTSFGAFVSGFVTITDGKKFGIGSSISIQLPKKILKLFEEGKIEELEEGIEIISGIEKPGDKMGAIGILTRGLLDRKKAFVDAIISALAPFITNYYD